jgi:hypothetical protein
LVHAGVLVITAASHGNAKFACRSFGIHSAGLVHAGNAEVFACRSFGK